MRVSGKSDLVEITLQLHAETEKAVLVSEDGNKKNAKWMPKSQIEIEKIDTGIISVTMPEWLATEKGFV